jgi:hypothetical protein
MDLLSQRYASPCFLLNGMIQTGRLDEFVDDFIVTVQKEKEEQVNWEFYLHKVFEGTFSDFVDELETNKKNQNLSARTIETTIQKSMDILNNFNPNRGGE